MYTHFLQCSAVSWTYLFWVRGFGRPSLHTSQLSSRAEAAAWSPEYNFAKFPPPVALFSPLSLLSFHTLSCTRSMPTFWAHNSILFWMCCSVGLAAKHVAGLTNFTVNCVYYKTCPSTANTNCVLKLLRLHQAWHHDNLKCSLVWFEDRKQIIFTLILTTWEQSSHLSAAIVPTYLSQDIREGCWWWNVTKAERALPVDNVQNNDIYRYTNTHYYNSYLEALCFGGIFIKCHWTVTFTLSAYN